MSTTRTIYRLYKSACENIARDSYAVRFYDRDRQRARDALGELYARRKRDSQLARRLRDLFERSHRSDKRLTKQEMQRAMREILDSELTLLVME